MRILAAMLFAVSATSAWAQPAQAPGRAAKEGAAFTVELDKEPEMKKAPEVTFVNEGGPASDRAFTGYKHSGTEAFEKVAQRKKILVEGWEQKCMETPACGKILEEGSAKDPEPGKSGSMRPSVPSQPAKPGKGVGDVKKKVAKVAGKIAFLKAAKKKLQNGIGEAKRKGDVEGEQKCGEAKKLIERDLGRQEGEAKKLNDALMIEAVDPAAGD